MTLFPRDKFHTLKKHLAPKAQDLFRAVVKSLAPKLRDRQFILLGSIFVIVAVVLGAVSLSYFYNYSNRPARLEIIKIVDQACSECFDLENILSQIRSENVKIKREIVFGRESREAKELISRYKIVRLPTFIVGGEINKYNELAIIWKKFGQVFDNTFVFTRVFPPYIVAETGNIRGRFNLTYLVDLSCSECYDVRRHDLALANLGLKVTSENSKVIEIETSEGQRISQKYNIKHLPTIVLSGDLNEYAPLLLAWPQVGSVESDGAHIFREKGLKIMGTYKVSDTGQLVTDN